MRGIGQAGTRGSWRRLGFALLALACSSPEQRAAEHLERARELRGAGRERAAILELQSAFRVDPENAEACFRLGETLEQLGENQDASFFYAEAHRIDPSRHDAMLAEARLALAAQPERAEKLIETVLDRDPDDALAHVRRSELALLREDFDAARRAAERALELGDPDGLASLQRARIARARLLERWLADETFDVALAETALEWLEGAAQRDPDSWRVPFERALVLGSWPERTAEATPLYERAVEGALREAPRWERRAALLQAYRHSRATQDSELARRLLDAWVERDPGDLFAWRELARLEEREGGFAEEVYRRMLAARPEDANAHSLYVQQLLAAGRGSDAIAHLREAAAQAERVRPALLGELVRLQLLANDAPAARETLAELEGDFEEAPETALARGRVLEAEGRLAEASAALRASPELGANLPAQRLLAELELRRGQPDLALSALEQALRIAGGTEPRLWALKGRAHSELGEWQPAAQSFRRLAASGARLRAGDWLDWARALYELEQPEPARRLLQRSLQHPRPVLGAALEYARREAARDPEGARRVLEAWLEAPRLRTHPSLLGALVRIDLREGKGRQARDRLDRLLADHGPDPGLRLLRARLLAELGETAEAEEDVRALLGARPDWPEAVRLFATLQARAGRIEASMAALEARRAELTPAEEIRLAALHRERGDEARARALYEALLARDDALAGVKGELAELLAREGADPERALRLANEAHAAFPDEPIVMDQRGTVYLRSELPDLALQEFRRASDRSELRGAPQARYHYHRGLALQELAQPDRARRAFERALELDPGFEAARSALHALAARSPRAPNASGTF